VHDLLTDLSPHVISFVSVGYKLGFLWYGFVMILFSCKKEDRTPAAVSILSPVQPPTYLFQDWVEVEISASDETGLREVTVSITDLQGRIAAGPKRVVLDGETNYSGTLLFRFDDVQAESGQYILRAKASDGSNEGQDVLACTLYGAQKEMTQLLVLRQPDSFTTQIDSLLGNNSLAPALSISGQYTLGVSNSWFQRIHAAGRTTDGISTWEVPSLFFSQQVVIPYGLGTSLYTDMCYDENSHEVWVSSRDGIIRQIGSTGTILASFQAYFPQRIIAVGKYVYSYGFNGLNSRVIEVYLKSTGQLMQSFTLDFEVSELLPLENEDRILLVRSGVSVSPMIPYERIGNYINVWTGFSSAPVGEILRACAHPQGVVVAYSNGIRFHAFSGAAGATSSQGYAPVQMAFQVNSPVLWLLEEDQLLALQFGNGFTLAGTFPTGGNARELVVVYNK